ncbi:MAG: sigma-54 dependent transcriptional regulator [Planctomycetaceae bacterium]|jgi:two-component system NtrC family response regulator|nr:sigma-54 dependent transcriptional regulator [Planctomycetaceae bacterium]
MRILLADDEPVIRTVVTEDLHSRGHSVTPCADGAEAVLQLEKSTFDVLILDLVMPKTGGLDVLRRARELGHDADVIILSGNGTFQDASAASQLGITGIYSKPYKIEDIEKQLNRIAEKRSGRQPNILPKPFPLNSDRTDNESDRSLIGKSEPMQHVHRLIDKIAPTDASVVILGETGTGKELVARAIHHSSRRSEKPFVAVNCGALPDNLIESELFGHKKGSFTGAETNRTGLLEVANGGTLFLDEIGELPKGVQAKLLRFLESGEVRKIGDNTAAVCDVRVVCATLRHLETMVQEGTFREDLWFRINTFEIHLPPLRDRKEDLPELILHFVKRFRTDRAVTDAAKLFQPEAYQLLLQYDYPGNVRQLANTIEHALVLSGRFPIQAVDLPAVFCHPSSEQPPAAVPETKHARPVIEYNTPQSGRSGVHPPLNNTHSPHDPAHELMAFSPEGEAATLRDLEMRAIGSALSRNGGNKAKAAEELGISLKTLYNKINQSDKQTA